MIWHELVDDARRAPSPHNTQAWVLDVVDDAQAVLTYRPERLLPVEDPAGAFLTCGMGIFAEALRVAAAARGLVLADEFCGPCGPASVAATPVARLSLAAGPEERDDRALLLRRRTSRIPYDGRPAPEDALADLSETGRRGGHVARFSSDPDFVRWVLELNAATLFYDLAEDERRAEIRHWTRTSNRAANRSGDGFSPRCMGFPGVLIWLFFDHHRAIRPLEPVIRRLYAHQLRGTATVGWIEGPWRSPQDWYDAGRMLLRFWLAATAHGLVLQPFGSVITNPTSHARLAERIEAGADPVWLLLRLGYSREPPRSERLPAEELIR